MSGRARSAGSDQELCAATLQPHSQKAKNVVATSKVSQQLTAATAEERGEGGEKEVAGHSENTKI